MRYRKLRIAWSVMCAIACVLLIVLWVRSYWWSEIFVSDRWQPRVVVSRGKVFYDADYSYTWNRDIKKPLEIKNSGHWYHIQSIRNLDRTSLTINKARNRVLIWPFVVGTVAATTFSWLPWLRFRFGLRTLLIATTLVAVTLGLIVWSTR
jgi:hypothetical protein